MGVSNQIAISKGDISVPQSDWRNAKQETIASDQDVFRRRLAGLKPDDSSLDFQAPFSPSATLVQQCTWQANDPLVHYTLDDLTSAELTNEVAYIEPSQGRTPFREISARKNKRYYPWPSAYSDSGNDVPARMIYRDPLIFGSDSWNFPTNHFPSVGWIGRIHRGTPWQTMYLKAETEPDVTREDHDRVGSKSGRNSSTHIPNERLAGAGPLHGRAERERGARVVVSESDESWTVGGCAFRRLFAHRHE